MNWKNEWKTLASLIAVFLAFFYLPVGIPRFDNAVMESLYLARWYAREHVLLFVAASLVVFIVHSSRTGESAVTGETSEGTGGDPLPESTTPDVNIDIVYYFMTTQRCPSCGVVFNKLTMFELWARRLTGAVFIVVGLYLSLKYIFNVL